MILAFNQVVPFYFTVPGPFLLDRTQLDLEQFLEVFLINCFRVFSMDLDEMS